METLFAGTNVSLFGWLFRKRRNVEAPDRIWLSEAATRNGLATAVRERWNHSRLIIVVASFPNRLVELESLLNELGLPFERMQRSIDAAQIADALRESSDVRILLGTGDLLFLSEIEPDDIDNAVSVSILVRERHPLRAVDERIEQFARSLPCQTTVQFFVSLDDALMKRFSGEWVKNLLRQMGMAESEAIESPMVARRIKAAQQKVAQQVLETPTSAASGDDWFAANSTS